MSYCTMHEFMKSRVEKKLIQLELKPKPKPKL